MFSSIALVALAATCSDCVFAGSSLYLLRAAAVDEVDPLTGQVLRNTPIIWPSTSFAGMLISNGGNMAADPSMRSLYFMGQPGHKGPAHLMELNVDSGVARSVVTLERWFNSSMDEGFGWHLSMDSGAVLVLGHHLMKPSDPLKSGSTFPILRIQPDTAHVEKVADFPGGGVDANGNGDAPGIGVGDFDTRRRIWQLMGLPQHQHHVTQPELTAIRLTDGQSWTAPPPTLLSFLAYLPGAGGVDDYYGFGMCSSPLGGELAAACIGHEGNWSFLHFNVSEKGVGSPTVVRVYSEPFLKGFGQRIGNIGCGGAVDVLSGRFSIFTTIGDSFPPEAVLSTFALPSGELLSAVDMGKMFSFGSMLPFSARYMPASSSTAHSSMIV